MTLRNDYTGHAVLTYSPEGEFLGEGMILSHDKQLQWIELRNEFAPSTLKKDDICPLLIMTAPSPHEYKGRVVKYGKSLVFAIFKGKEKEDRATARHKVNLPITIEELMNDGNTSSSHEKIAANVINISRTGVRFSIPHKSLLVGDKVSFRMRVAENDRLYAAVVVNSISKDSNISEYGCRLVSE